MAPQLLPAMVIHGDTFLHHDYLHWPAPWRHFLSLLAFFEGNGFLRGLYYLLDHFLCLP